MGIRYDIDSENVKKQALLNLMKDMSLQTLQIAFVYAENYKEYGEDVTKTWNTATEQSSILAKAYRKGYHDALQKQAEGKAEEKTYETIKALEQEPYDDAISRQAVINLCERFDGCVPYSVLSNYDMLPPVNPQPKTGHCRDCKRWKDSDGVYRRGIGAESECPINRKEVYEGNGYCFMFEPQGSEEV